METGLLKVICAYCKRQIGTKPCSKENDGKISHGICPDCELRANKELDMFLVNYKENKKI